VEQLLAASSDPFWVIAMFFAALFCFHVALIKKFPLSLKQWKLVEYIWVALALVSIFSIIDEARFYRSDLHVEQSQANAMEKAAAFENWFEVYVDYACNDTEFNSGSEDLCRWVKVKASDLDLILENEEFPYDIPQNFLIGIDADFKGLGQADRAIAKGVLRDYVQAREQYLSAINDGRYSGISAFLVALAPMVFAIAIALKFTKVTGEYLLTK
jgi:hypothetical protein